MIYSVYTDQHLVRNTSDTVYTTRHVCCENASPLDIIWALLSCVCFTEGLDSCRHRGKTRRSSMLFLCALAKLGEDIQCNSNTYICKNASQGDQISISINSVYLQSMLLISCLCLIHSIFTACSYIILCLS